MKVLIKGISIRNEWRLHHKYKGIRGLIRRLGKENMERALAFKMKFGEKEVTIDLSLMTDEDYTMYLFMEPIPFDTRDKTSLETIPEEPDIAPREVQVIWDKDSRPNIEVI